MAATGLVVELGVDGVGSPIHNLSDHLCRSGI